MIRRIFFVVCLDLLILFSSGISQHTLFLSPQLVELSLSPGERTEFNLLLGNEDESNPVNLLVFLSDFIELEDGGYKVIDKGTSRYSCADWMTVSDSLITLAPKNSKEIKVQIKVPRDVVGGRYGAVVFEIVPEPVGPEKPFIQRRYHFRMPAFVEVTVKKGRGLVKKVSLTDLKVTPSSADPQIASRVGKDNLIVKGRVKNEGNIHINGKGRLIIRNKDGRKVREYPLGAGAGTVLPDATCDFVSVIQQPRPGDYVAQVILNYGAPSPVIANIPFTVSKYGTALKGNLKTSIPIALELQPERVEQVVPPGAFRVMSFLLINNEDKSLVVNTKLHPMQFDPEGEIVLLENTEAKWSCQDWLKIEPIQFTLKPYERKPVRATITVPSLESGGRYTCVVFEAHKQGEKEALSTSFQIPVLLSIPKEKDFKGEIVKSEINFSKGSPPSLIAYFKNLGNIHFKPRGKVVIKNFVEIPPSEKQGVAYAGKSEYEKVGEFIFQEIKEFVLPDGVRKMETIFPSVFPPGKYLAEIDMEYGGNVLAKAQKAFIIK